MAVLIAASNAAAFDRLVRLESNVGTITRACAAPESKVLAATAIIATRTRAKEWCIRLTVLRRRIRDALLSRPSRQNLGQQRLRPTSQLRPTAQQKLTPKF